MKRWLVGMLLPLALSMGAGCGDDGENGNRAMPTVAPSPSSTAVPASATVPASTPTSPASATATPSVTATVTVVPPQITYLGVANAEDVPQTPVATDAQGRPVYQRILGQGLQLIVEAQAGSRDVGLEAYNPGGLPDLQVIVSRPLGDGSTAVCDAGPEIFGGVPATTPLEFGGPGFADAVNDLGCRVNDGTGLALGRTNSLDACTRSGDVFGFGFVAADTTVQYCLPIARDWSFPDGDTIVAARVLDVGGAASAASEIVVRVLGAPTAGPSGTPTLTPTITPTPIPPRITYLGIASADDMVQQPIGTDAEGRPIFLRLQGQGMSLVVEAARGSRPLGLSAYDPEGGAPDLQLLVSRPLGDGSPAVCDFGPDVIGGIPATDPLEFSDQPAVVGAMNDLGCRVNDGAANPLGRPNSGSACTQSNDPFGFGFVAEDTDVQYCLPVAHAWAFAPGDTIVAARVRDTDGTISAVSEIVVRVMGSSTVPCDNLTERDFTLGRPGSALLSTALNDNDVTMGEWDSIPLRLCIGDPADNGQRSLRLIEGVTIGMQVLDGSVLCVHLSAEDSGGAIACGGASGYDVTATQDSDGEGVGGPLMISTAVSPDPVGAAILLTRASFVALPVGSTPINCSSVRFGAGIPIAMTTGTGTASVLNPIQGGEVSLTATGEPFDCARLDESGSGGTFVLPFTALDDPIHGDTAQLLILRE
jgi:hypothetical protein